MHGMDCVEELHRVGGFIRLKPADSVHADARLALNQTWPFAERLLDAVFTEIGLPGLDQSRNLLSGTAFADRNELNFTRIALREFRRARDSVQDSLSPLRRTTHGRGYRKQLEQPPASAEE